MSDVQSNTAALATQDATDAPTSTWQERLIAEAKEMDERAAKLSAFIKSDDFQKLPHRQQYLLNQQWGLMFDLSGILDQRVAELSQ